MENERSMGGLDLIFWPEIYGNTVFPFFKLLIKLSDCVEELSIGLLRCLGRVKSFIDLAFDSSERAHRSEQIEFPFPVRQWNVSDIIWRIFAWKFDIHVVVILHRRSTRTEAHAAESEYKAQS